MIRMPLRTSGRAVGTVARYGSLDQRVPDVGDLAGDGRRIQTVAVGGQRGLLGRGEGLGGEGRALLRGARQAFRGGFRLASKIAFASEYLYD
jgi:hypothetical protein